MQELEKFPCDCQDLTLELEMRQTTKDVQLAPLYEGGSAAFHLETDQCFLNDFSLMEIPCVFGLYNSKPRLKQSKFDRRSSYGKSLIGAQVTCLL